MGKYLLEIGLEELPYSLIEPICNQIKTNLEKKLQENNASFTAITTYCTPRRLTFIIDGLNETQPDNEKTYKGPNYNIAILPTGEYSPAAVGFAKKLGLSADQLQVIEDKGQKYIAAKIVEPGKNIFELIPSIVPDAVLKVQGSHFMRWSNFDEKFSRPIRWIVSIFNDQEIPVEITGIKSSKTSRAHRFCADKYPVITDVDSYKNIMYQHNVIVDEAQRKEQIIKSVKEIAQSINAEVKIEDELLKEVTNIVEWPKPVLGTFDKDYLQIPEPIIVTVMAKHQRYFPVYDKNGNILNYFITVANYVGDDFSNITNGNERVIKARLDDAIFFYKEDIKKPLIDRTNDLEGMTFQKGLGSLKDKVARIIKISDYMAKALAYKEYEQTYKDILRTALFCKSDLTTSLVFEFTELQGVIGSYYAKLFGENDAVAKGIKEHYYPLVSDAQLAEGIEGQIVGIADKLDTICGVFILNKIPTGSADPLGVRRAAIGILQTIMQKHLNINLYNLIDIALLAYKIDESKLELYKKDISIFFIQRLKGIFAGKYPTDYLDAIIATRTSLQFLYNIEERLNVISNNRNTEEFDKLIETHNRIYKILKNQNITEDNEENNVQKYSQYSKDIFSNKKTTENRKNIDIIHATTSNIINPELFVNDSEDNLYRYMLELKTKQILAFSDYYKLLVAFTPLAEEFFANVMVMDENISIRNNHLRLLKEINKMFFKIADFTKIIK